MNIACGYCGGSGEVSRSADSENDICVPCGGTGIYLDEQDDPHWEEECDEF